MSSPRRGRHAWWHLAPVLLFTTPVHGALHAQDTKPPQQARSAWHPRRVRFAVPLAPAQLSAALATLEKVEQLLRQVPALATPDGFEIEPVVSGGARQLGPDQKVIAKSVFGYNLTLMFHAPTKALAREGCTCITVRVNETQSGSMIDAGRIMYIEAARAMEPRGTPREIAGTLWQVPAATQVYGELWDFSRDIREGRGERSSVNVLFVGAGELPWQPVSREAFYAANRLEREGADGSKSRELRAALAKTPYEQWMEEAPERKKSRDESLAAARGHMTPDEFAKMQKALEDTDREVTEQLRKTAADDRARNREALAMSDRLRDDLTRELEAMTPEERRMPVYINNALQEGPMATGWRLTSDSAPPGWRVLTPNYNFWRARRSPAEVRSINVQISISGTGLRPNVRKALLQTFRTLDWPAFNQLLDTPR